MAHNSEGQFGRPCPLCRHPMFEVTVPEEDQSLKLDVCRICQFVWFDPAEFDSVPLRRVAPAQHDDHSLPQQARERLAIAECRLLAEADQDLRPTATWKTIPALFGLPVEDDTGPLKSFPRMTCGLTAFIILTSIIAFFNLQPAIDDLGFIPSEALRSGGATLVTSFFIHGGVLHLASNMYFLFIFGAVVEDVLGAWEWLALVMLAALTGDLLHLATNWNSDTPCIGASGGISGLIAFYALRFPRAKLSFMLGLFFRFRWIQVSAWFAFAGWVMLQCLEALSQRGGQPGVANFAHLGGAFAGFIFWLRWRHKSAASRSAQNVAVP